MGKAVASGSRSGLKCECGKEDELQHKGVKVEPGGFSEGEFPCESLDDIRFADSATGTLWGC